MPSKKGQRSTPAPARSQRKGRSTPRKGSPEASQAAPKKGERQRTPIPADLAAQRTPTPVDLAAQRSAPPTMPPGEATAMFRPFEAMMRTATAFAEVAMGSAFGAMLGATRGAIKGGLAGLEQPEQSGEMFDENYWRESFGVLPYVDPDVLFSQYRPAFQFGWQQAVRNAGTSFDEIEEAMAQAWEQMRGNADLSWKQAKDAVRDAFERTAASLAT